MYLSVIVMFASKALGLGWYRKSTYAKLAMKGALLFTLSDGILALTTFVYKGGQKPLFCWQQLTILSTYWLALACLSGSAKEPTKAKRKAD